MDTRNYTEDCTACGGMDGDHMPGCAIASARPPLDHVAMLPPDALRDAARDFRAVIALGILLMLFAFALGLLVGWSI